MLESIFLDGEYFLFMCEYFFEILGLDFFGFVDIWFIFRFGWFISVNCKVINKILLLIIIIFIWCVCCECVNFEILCVWYWFLFSLVMVYF